MSFILDALRKSETDRQEQGSAEFAGVPTSNRREGPPRWLWILGLLLAVNLLVLTGLLLRPAGDSRTVALQPVATSNPEAGISTDSRDEFAAQVAEARQNAPVREEPQPVRTRPISADTQQPPVAASRSPAMNTATLPTIHEVIANGTMSLPELHVDIHVYSESREDRFVFINMNKHNEGSRLAEGPLVQEITPDGVVLNHNGMAFLLPRD